MTKISQIYDYLVSELREEFPHKVQLFNPYEISVNNELYLKDGFGVGFGPGVPEEIIGCCQGFSRDILITLSRQFYAMENDAIERMNHEKVLMEEFVQLVKKIEKDVQLGGNAANCQYASDSGVRQVFTQSQQYIYLTIVFQTKYFENLT